MDPAPASPQPVLGATQPTLQASLLPFALVPMTGIVFLAVGLLVVGPEAVHVLAFPAAAMLGGAVVAWPAVREAARDPRSFGRALVLCVLPETSVILAFVAAFLFVGPSAPPLASLVPLWAVGGFAALAILFQASFLGAKLGWAVRDENFGRFLVVYAAPSILPVSALATAILLWR